MIYVNGGFFDVEMGNQIGNAIPRKGIFFLLKVLF